MNILKNKYSESIYYYNFSNDLICLKKNKITNQQND